MFISEDTTTPTLPCSFAVSKEVMELLGLTDQDNICPPECPFYYNQELKDAAALFFSLNAEFIAAQRSPAADVSITQIAHKILQTLPKNIANKKEGFSTEDKSYWPWYQLKDHMEDMSPIQLARKLFELLGMYICHPIGENVPLMRRCLSNQRVWNRRDR